MSRQSLTVLSASALLSIALACSESPAPLTPTTPTTTPTGGTVAAAADGSTLKVSPGSAISPANNVKLTSSVVVLTAGPVAFTYAAPGAPALQYHFQVLNAAGTVVKEALVSGLTWTVPDNVLLGNTTYSWQVRAESAGQAGPWSSRAAFVSADPFVINDPLTNGRTVGNQIGGSFVPGQGWRSNSLTDGIDYDLKTPCIDCRLEFDATNFGAEEGAPFEKDLKWLSMGEADAFSSFGVFRDHPWKMHLVQRADFPTGMEIIWRNGGTDPAGDPGDHRIKLTSTPITFSSSSVYHFQLDWDRGGYRISVNGIEVMADGWGYPFAPTSHRIELGCVPRADSFPGIIYRNVVLRNH